MYGEHVWITTGDEIEARVFVWCTPDTSIEAKRLVAKEKLVRILMDKVAAGGDNSAEQDEISVKE